MLASHIIEIRLQCACIPLSVTFIPGYFETDWRACWSWSSVLMPSQTKTQLLFCTQI